MERDFEEQLPDRAYPIPAGLVTRPIAFVPDMRRCFFVMLMLTVIGRAERINHEGRILGPQPVVTSQTLFNTPAADDIVSAMQIMPVDNAWNEDVSTLPLLPNSAAMIARIKADLASNRQNLTVPDLGGK